VRGAVTLTSPGSPEVARVHGTEGGFPFHCSSPFALCSDGDSPALALFMPLRFRFYRGPHQKRSLPYVLNYDYIITSPVESSVTMLDDSGAYN
jgi:hypothetical protein